MRKIDVLLLRHHVLHPKLFFTPKLVVLVVAWSYLAVAPKPLSTCHFGTGWLETKALITVDIST